RNTRAASQPLNTTGCWGMMLRKAYGNAKIARDGERGTRYGEAWVGTVAKGFSCWPQTKSPARDGAEFQVRRTLANQAAGRLTSARPCYPDSTTNAVSGVLRFT